MRSFVARNGFATSIDRRVKQANDVKVANGITSAVKQAKAVAAGKSVGVHGADTIQQLLNASLLDEIHVDIAAVLLGSGVRLFDHLAGTPAVLGNPTAIAGHRGTCLSALGRIRIIEAYKPDLVLVEVRPEPFKKGNFEDGPFEMTFVAGRARAKGINVAPIDWWQESDFSAPETKIDPATEKKMDAEYVRSLNEEREGRARRGRRNVAQGDRPTH